VEGEVLLRVARSLLGRLEQANDQLAHLPETSAAPSLLPLYEFELEAITALQSVRQAVSAVRSCQDSAELNVSIDSQLRRSKSLLTRQISRLGTALSSSRDWQHASELARAVSACSRAIALIRLDAGH
jgi:hypothetical protein